MRGSLLHWKRDIEADVRIVMRAEGLEDLSVPACKEWVRRFIRLHVPWWRPGEHVGDVQIRALGAEFESRLAAAKHQRDALAWQDG